MSIARRVNLRITNCVIFKYNLLLYCIFLFLASYFKYSTTQDLRVLLTAFATIFGRLFVSIIAVAISVILTDCGCSGQV